MTIFSPSIIRFFPVGQEKVLVSVQWDLLPVRREAKVASHVEHLSATTSPPFDKSELISVPLLPLFHLLLVFASLLAMVLPPPPHGDVGLYKNLCQTEYSSLLLSPLASYKRGNDLDANWVILYKNRTSNKNNTVTGFAAFQSFKIKGFFTWQSCVDPLGRSDTQLIPGNFEANVIKAVISTFSLRLRLAPLISLFALKQPFSIISRRPWSLSKCPSSISSMIEWYLSKRRFC
jgi:hypothetical protein